MARGPMVRLRVGTARKVDEVIDRAKRCGLKMTRGAVLEDGVAMLDCVTPRTMKQLEELTDRAKFVGNDPSFGELLVRAVDMLHRLTLGEDYGLATKRAEKIRYLAHREVADQVAASLPDAIYRAFGERCAVKVDDLTGTLTLVPLREPGPAEFLAIPAPEDMPALPEAVQ